MSQKESAKNKILILTEKPSVGRDFAKALGQFQNNKTFLENENFIITWAIGHLLTPFDPEDYDKKFKKWTFETLPIIPTEFQYKPIAKTHAQLKAVLAQLKRKDIGEIIVATDAGREGELIARLILNQAKIKVPMKRFFTSEALTKEVIAREMGKLAPLSSYDRMYKAGLLRQKIDWLMGMNLTRAATLKLGDLFSIGRVQTAVLSLLVRRHLERENFKPEDYFELKINVKKDKAQFDLFWFRPKAQEHPRRLSDKNIFEKLVLGFNVQKEIEILEVNTEEKKNTAWGIFSLTDLQRKANLIYGFSASKTLDIAQDLYEKDKCLSYPRTDSKFLGKSSFGLVKNILKDLEQSYSEYFKKFDQKLVHPNHKAIFNDEKLTDHHGLIPLRVFKGRKDSDHWKIYQLVLKEFISVFSIPHKYLETKILGTHQLTKSFYETRGVQIIEIGYKYLESRNLETEKSESEVSTLPELRVGEKVIYQKHKIEEKKTIPPALYNEATLLYEMTNPARLVDESEMKRIFRGEVGLGTQSTRANIIETLIKRGYIKRDKKNLMVQEKAILLIAKLSKMQSSKDLTSVRQTAKMELVLEEISQGETKTNLELESIELMKQIIAHSVKEWSDIESMPSVNGPRKTYGKNSINSESLGPCPLCKSGQIVEMYKSFSCTEYKGGCKFAIWKVMSSKKIGPTIVKKLITKKCTEEIKGFKSKSGKNFSAKLILNNEYKVEFSFK